MKLHYISLFIVACIFEQATQSVILDIDPEKLALIDRRIEEEFMPTHNVPGLALTIVGANSSYLTRSYGLRDREESIPVTNNTRFLIASNSKSFTSIIACRTLLEHFPQLGQSALDVPIAELVPSYNFTLSDKYRTEEVTFRDLLAHRTCLASYGLGVTAGAYISKQDRVYRYRYLKEKCAFRTYFEYSSAMYIQAGEIVAHIAGKQFNQLVMELFQELGMTDSLIVNETEDYETLPNMSRGYFINKDGLMEKMPARLYNGHSGAASGGIISTADDMGKYLMLHLRKGRVGDRQVVPEEIFNWVRTASMHLEERWIALGEYAYGMGLFIGLHDGWSRIGHYGDLSPFISRFSLFPAKQLGIFTALNGPGLLPRESDQSILHNDIFDILYGNTRNSKLPSPYCSSDNNLIFKAKEKVDATSPAKKIDGRDLAGVYGNSYEGEFLVIYNESDPEMCPLEIHYGLWGRGCLREISETSDIYIVDWFGEIIKLLYAYSGGLPVEELQLDFRTENSVFFMDGYSEIEYRRNATLATFPPIPWSNTSCGPDYTMRNPIVF